MRHDIGVLKKKKGTISDMKRTSLQIILLPKHQFNLILLVVPGI